MSSPLWDAAQYARFRAERAQPFHDLLTRVPEREDVSRIADLGCGDGELTRTLLERWPQAQIWGVDNSPEMLAKASSVSSTPGLRFVLDDLQSWVPPEPLDLIVSNAALHWVSDHKAVLGALASRLAPAGIVAIQVPKNGDERAYRILEALLQEPKWRERLGGGVQRPFVEAPSFYEGHLRALGLACQVWETVYYHRLAASTEIVEWLKGTSLRPVLSALSKADASVLLNELTSRVVLAYPEDRWGVLFPFRRLFFVGLKS